MLFTIEGHQAYAYTGGRRIDPARRSVAFIHGAANDHSVWAWQTRWFAAHDFNAIAFDLPGHGRSAGTAPASVTALAGWIDVALGELGLDSAVLVGHSMGSLAALETAARYSARVERLALLGCAVPMGVSDTLLDAARDDPASAIRMITQWSHAPSTLLGASPIPGIWLPAANGALMARAAPGVLHRDLLNCREYVDGLAAAAAVQCPTLIVAGRNDLMTPAKAAEQLRTALPQAQLTCIDGAGHAMMSERADAVLAALRTFAL
jgi:pimeloyl-ACP methyl ester carboxylesterase